MDTRTGKIYSPKEMDFLDQMKQSQEKFDKGMDSICSSTKDATEAANKLHDALEDLKGPVALSEFCDKHMIAMKLEPTKKQLRLGKVSRDDACPCGSGKKFKACCFSGYTR